MEESAYTIFEERDELVFSPGGGNGSDTSLKTAHFLRPTSKTTNFQLLPRSISAKSATLRDSTPLAVSFKGWSLPEYEWRDWVDQLRPKHQFLWRKVGIYEAIMSTRCWIGRNRNVVFGLAEKWCSETNTFMFPWGEATLTLEDVMLLGGYPVLGYPILGNPFFSSPLSTTEERKTHEKLVKTLASCSNRKAWLNYFMGSEQELEHEAFLSAWLSKYVFPTIFSSSFIANHVFPIAVHLARGTPMALAPAVLSSIYRDLGFLKDKLVTLDEHMTSESLLLYAPFQILLLWVWERFPVLSPTPKAIASGDPRAARWDKLRSETGVESVRLAIDSAGESFQWRPYESSVNWAFPNCYGDEEQWIIVGPGLDKEFKSLVWCLRTSELVGPGCIQQYLPHRVAQQFGMDQDIPGLVGRRNGSPMIANSFYDRPIRDAKLYVPPRICRAGVTLQYSEWWKQLTQDTRSVIKQKPRNPMLSKDSASGRIDTRSSTESSFALVCHKSKVGGAVDNSSKNLDIDVQRCSSSGRDGQLASPADSLACTKMKQVTEKEGIEDMFRSVVTRTKSRRNKKRLRSLALILQEDNKKNDGNVVVHPESDETIEDGLSKGENNQDGPSDFAPTTAEMKKCDIVVRVETDEQIVSDALEGNHQELEDLTHVDSARKNLDVDVQQCSRSGSQRQLTSPAGSLACTEMKQVTEKEGIEDVFRSPRNRKRSKSLALVLQVDNRKDHVNDVFHPESDETKEEGLAEGAEQTREKIVGENNQEVPSVFSQTTTEMKKCGFSVKVETCEQIVRVKDEQMNAAEIPNHVAAPTQSPEVGNSKSVGQEENALLEKPQAETLFANGGESINYKVKIPGLKLEAMIAELEVKVAALKAARLKNVSVRDAKRTCCSFHSTLK